MRNIVAIDIGYSNLKIAVAHNSAIQVKLFPSGVVPADLYSSTFNEQDNVGVSVSVGNRQFVAATPQHSMGGYARILHENYPETDDYKALFLAGLYHCKSDTIDLLVTGLPAYQIKDIDRVQKLKDLMVGTHAVNGSRHVTVKRVDVYGQPMGAFADMLVNCNDHDRNLIKQSHVLVVDPGFFSVDWVMISHGRIVDRTISSSKEAMSVVLQEAATIIKQDYGLAPSILDLEVAMRQQRKFVMVGTNKVPVAKYLSRGSIVCAEEIIRKLHSDLRHLDYSPTVVLVAGGGANVYKKAITNAFPKADIRVSDAPVLANVRGFLSLGCVNG